MLGGPGGKGHQQRLGLALLGGEPEPGAHGGAYAAGRSGRPSTQDPTGGAACGRRRRSPGSRSGPEPTSPARPTISPGAHLEVERLELPFPGQPLDRQHGFVRRRGHRRARSGKTYSTLRPVIRATTSRVGRRFARAARRRRPGRPSAR